MYQNPPRYVPGPPLSAPRRRRAPVLALLLAPFVLFGLMFFGGSYAISPEPAVEVLPGLAFAEVDDTGTALSLVALTNGQVIGSLNLEADVTRAVTGPDGATAVAAREVLAVTRADGRLIRLGIGATNFFGSPS
jgi:hypothetical protein